MDDTNSILFRQLFDTSTSTYTYLIACLKTGKALLLDSVDRNIDLYTRLIKEFDLDLIYALDTHVHADHITAMSLLKEKYNCQLAMGEHTPATGVDKLLRDKEPLCIGDITLETMHTPGHTIESCSFILNDKIFTGDTLLIRGTGRTDFQNGSSKDQYNSLFNKLLKLPEPYLVYPSHDYNGVNISTIGEEIRFNPRLQVVDEQEYMNLMDNLNLPYPKFINVALPANLKCGSTEE
jgi:glyoxylase-like metal-dependent hydrolase (beta-lactamase superfamily II)